MSLLLVLSSLVLGGVACQSKRMPFTRTAEVLTVRRICSILLVDGVVMPDAGGHVDTTRVIGYFVQNPSESNRRRAWVNEPTWERWLRAGKCTDLLGREYDVKVFKKFGEDYISVALPEIEIGRRVYEGYVNDVAIGADLPN